MTVMMKIKVMEIRSDKDKTQVRGTAEAIGK